MNEESKYGSCPIYFSDESKKKEWDYLDPVIKKSVIARLSETIEKLNVESSLELLAHLINDIHKRLEILEKK